jgi:trimethylamine--corrinoid protein Co-methyltransferase
MINRRGNFLKVLTKRQLQDIHLATLDILEHVGVKVEHEGALKLLDNIGAYVDYRSCKVLIPSYLVNEMIKKTPPRFTYYGRNPKLKLQIESDHVYFLDGGTPLNVLDLDGNYRPATLIDLANLVRLYDALENVDLIAGPVFPTDVPEYVHHMYDYLTKLENTEKPFTHAHYTCTGEAKDLIKMASVLEGGIDELIRKPSIMGWENPISPLTHGTAQVENMIEFARHGLPVVIAPAVQSGGTGPATLAGVLVQQNAEILSGIVIAQSAAEQKRPPIVYGTAAATLEMRFGTTVYASPGAVLVNVASVQLARYYGMPSRGTGGVTESKIPDMQAGYESAITLLMLALAGCNLIMDAVGGALGPGIDAMSFEKAIIDNEIAGIASRILKGIDVSYENLALDVISEVGPGGQYLSHKHTLNMFFKEHFMPKISDKRLYASWIKDGGRDIRKVANEKARHILKEHKPAPIDKEKKEELIKILRETEKQKTIL